MPKIKYFILLSEEGDFLLKLDENSWRSCYYPSKTLFDTHSEATLYMSDMSIKSIWPEAKVERTLE